jgi:signal transduction histidine kinase/ligand-binding sensor domain-containing protein/DNA-binding response OmpR family regulator
MRIAYRFILLLSAWLFFCLQGFSQPGQLQFTHVDISNGLSHNQVNCILKDRQGFLWFGTLSGLNRYDGYGFKTFRRDLQDTLSLSDNYITGIFELPGGKLWINTRNGSNIYDAATETFDRHYQRYLKSLGLPEGMVTGILRDKTDGYWFVYAGDGIYQYDPRSHRSTPLRHQEQNKLTLSNNDVSALSLDSSGGLWVMQTNGILEKLDVGTRRVTYRNDSLFRIYDGARQNYKIFIDSQHDLWIYVSGDAEGVYYFNTLTHRVLHLSKDSRPYHLNNDIIYAITEDSNGAIWIGTDHGGINLINKKDFSIRYLMHNPEDPKSLAQNSIYALYKDNTGVIWVGTYKKGVCYYNEIFNRFPLYSHDPNLPVGKAGTFSCLPYEDVDRFVEDKRENLWIGTNGGGLIYFDRSNNTFRQYLHDPANPNSLCNNVIVGLCLDRQGKLWIGTYTGGLDCFDGKTFTHYRHQAGDSSSLSNDKVWDIFEDTKGNIWIGTMGGGLDLFDRQHQKFIHYRSGYPDVAGTSYVMAITEDKSGQLWLGTAGGVEVLSTQAGWVRLYDHHPGDPGSLCNDNINAISQDSRGWIWIATREGLSRFDPATGKFRNFMMADGLPDNTVLTILEDNEHRLWMSTPNGLSCLSIAVKHHKDTFLFKNYDESDGLQGREFNEKSAFKTREGQLLFGGANGFNMFDATHIVLNKTVPPVVFTDLQIFNKSVKIGETIGKHIILPKAINEVKSVTLPYGANDFSLVFAALGYSHSGKNKYRYKLEGFSENWITSGGGMHKATYTNLDPGTYIFNVMASNNDGIWGKQGASLQIHVLPPFWRTNWAYFIYALLIIGILYLARSILLYRARMNFRMEHQRHEAQRMHELDMMKIRFFTNISHEFRTPLTLILTPIERILKQTGDVGHKDQLQLIQRNARRLLHLVNQLLDFRKMEVQEIKLNPVHGEIISFIKEIVCSFTDIAEKKDIRFTLETALESLTAHFDKDKLERILFNLLSNAFKFTPEKGTITLYLDIQPAEAEANALSSYLRIRIQDNGIGIPPEKQQRIFERFFQHQMPPSVVNPGSGIGLSITREFVRLHKGTISVWSEPGKGSCFTVLLPVALSEVAAGTRPGNMPEIFTPAPLNMAPASRVTPKHHGRKPSILLIDDNEDFRFYLKDNFSVYFNVSEASNGKEGWEKTISLKPDLIVSDIMMPEMNGIELSRKLKRDPRTAQIPLILLTARASDEQQLEGYETGVNDYIAKPFNFEILLARIYNLLAEKKQQHKAEPPKIPLDPHEVDVVHADEKFIQDAIAVVEKNMANPGFSVEQLSHALYVSRVTLYKKIMMITGKSPVAFIRALRMKRAAQLLQEAKMTVAQTAYEVGFNNPKYFTKYFKEAFGMLPSEYAHQAKNQKEEKQKRPAD